MTDRRATGRRPSGEERLETYRGKRDFESTDEPTPRRRGGGSKAGKRPMFVVQEHAASSHHYDVRLEVDGVLVSWAVPKGPSTDPKEKRLAVPTEDHPMEYADFEGTIPAQDYGGGSVIVWDTGPYRNLTERKGEEVSMRDGLDAGHVSVWLEGSKLVGGWSFTRTGSNWMDHGQASRRPGRRPAQAHQHRARVGNLRADGRRGRRRRGRLTRPVRL